MTFLTSHPFQLVSFDEKNAFVLNENKLKSLLSSKKPLKTLSIVGKYREGKSSLLNLLFGIKKGGFQVGHKVDRQTKGVWMWAKEEQDYILVILDTEGLFDINNTEQIDLKILTLSMLLSSNLIINLKGNLDKNIFDTCFASSQFVKQIYFDLSSQNQIESFLPNLLFLIRDFSLELEQDYKNAKEYLISSLSFFEKENPNYNPSISKNPREESVRRRNIEKKEFLHDFDNKLDCDTLENPFVNTQLVGDFEENTNINERFKFKVDKLYQKIINEIKIKKLNFRNSEQQLTGENFTDFLKIIIDSINTYGREMNVSIQMSYIKYFQKIESTKYIEKAVSYFKTNFENFEKTKIQLKIPSSIQNLKYYDTFKSNLDRLFSLKEKFDFDKLLKETTKLISSSNKINEEKINNEIIDQCKNIYFQKVIFFEKIIYEKFESLKISLKKSIDEKEEIQAMELENYTCNCPKSHQDISVDIEALINQTKEMQSKLSQISKDSIFNTFGQFILDQIQLFTENIEKTHLEFYYHEIQSKFITMLESLVIELFNKIAYSTENLRILQNTKNKQLDLILNKLYLFKSQIENEKLQKQKKEEEKKQKEIEENLRRVKLKQEEEERRRVEEIEKKKRIKEQLELQRKKEAEIERQRLELEKIKFEEEKKKLEEEQRQKIERLKGAYLCGNWQFYHHRFGNVRCSITYNGSQIIGTESSQSGYSCRWTATINDRNGAGNRNSRRFNNMIISIQIQNDNSFIMTFNHPRFGRKSFIYKRY